MNEERKGLPQRYVNTPFAYTRLQKGLTLLQQNIMMKAVEHVGRHHLKEFFQNPELLESKDSPKPIMTEEDIENFPPLRVRFADLGITASHYDRVQASLRKLLSITTDKPIVGSNGVKGTRTFFVFTYYDTPFTEKGTIVRKRLTLDSPDLTEMQVKRLCGYVDLYLNRDLLREIFDMNQGYITHPNNIASIGKVENMPLMYYFVRHNMQNFKVSKAKISTLELREYLGSAVRDQQGNVTIIKYPRYSVFRDRFLRTALDDIKRVYDAGQIDFYFEMKEIRADGRKTGDPNFLEFRKVGNAKKEDAKYRANSEKKLSATLLAQYPTLDAKTLRTIFASVPQEQWDDFKGYAYNGVPKAVEQPHRWNGTHEDFVYYLMRSWIKERKTAEPVAAQPQAAQPGANEWRAFMAGYNGMLKEQLAPAEFVSLDGDGTLTLRLSAAEWEALSEKEKDIPPISVQSFYHHLTLALGRKVAKIQYDIR